MTETKRPLKVFLCHAHADRDAVKALYTRLTNDGVDAWLDKEKLLPGQDWELEIRKAVREADVVVVCLSKQFNQAGFRQKEVRLALDTAMEKPEGEIFIIPARLEECDTLESLRKWNWVDLFQDDGYERLIRALQARANKIDTTLQIKRRRESKKKEKPVGYSRQERVLEAAIEKQVSVGVPASLFVWIKRIESKSIISVVSSIDEEVMLDEDNVKSKGLEIEFPIEDGFVQSVGISLRLVAHEFDPSVQQKKIMVPPDGDSEVCTFIVTPRKVGRLLLNLEILRDDISLATRTLRTIAIEGAVRETNPLVLVSIPIVVVVNQEYHTANDQSVSVGSINVGGDVQGNIVIGSNSVDKVLESKSAEIVTQKKEKHSSRKQGKKLSDSIIVALIGFVGTIIAALFGSPLIKTLYSPVPMTIIPVIVTSTTVPSPIPTDTVPAGEPTSTSAPATDTPAPTVTVTPIPSVGIGKDWSDGCISSLWVPYSSKEPVDAMDRGDGCLLQPVEGFFVENGKLSFLYEDRLSSAEVHGMFAPLPSSSGTVSIYIRLKTLNTSDIWIGVFADPSLDSSGLLMTIPASNDISSSPFVAWTMPDPKKITSTGVVNQGNGYGVKFEYTAGSVKAVVLPNVPVTNQIPVSSAQKYIFIGYQGEIGTNRIDGSFFNLVVTE